MRSKAILWICAVIATILMVAAWVMFGSGALQLKRALIVTACAILDYAMLILNL